MHDRYDVIIVGIGAMGSAAAWRLAKRGARVLALEQFTIGHDRGSSHGETRLIRQAYFEHPDYVPLLRQAYTLWQELEGEAKVQLFHQNGLIIYGPRDGAIMQGIGLARDRHGIQVTSLDAVQATKMFPLYHAPKEHIALLEPGAGYLMVEHAVRTMAQQAAAAGATILETTPVYSTHSDADGVTVSSKAGTHRAKRLILTAGAWSPALLQERAGPLQVRRVPLAWFSGDARYAACAGSPCFGYETEIGLFYGFPAVSEQGVKVGLHQPGAVVAHPDQLDRTVHDRDLAPLIAFVREHLPGVEPRVLAATICMYTMTPDEHFVIDQDQNTVFAAGFSGHGFKFAPVIGEALADLALDGQTPIPINFLKRRPHP